jgi:hypothetical protein
MKESAKSGQNLLDDFFSGVTKIDGVDPAVGKVLKELHDKGRLTSTNIENELRALRESENGGETNKD